MTLRLVAVGCALLFSACKCTGPSLGPLEDPKPASLGATGLLVDQPADGETIDAEWVTVSGWVDRSRYAFVAVVGAPSSSFYASSGHAGVPSVPVLVRDDGRFIAPRVPLGVGQTQLLIIALTHEGTAGAQADRSVNSAFTRSPATIVVSPAEGGQAPLSVSFEPHTRKKVDNWQWDYEGDGHFDEEGLTGRHRYEKPGSYIAYARTRMDGRWLWAVAPVQVMGEDDITHQSTAVTAPRAVIVVPLKVDMLLAWENEAAIGQSDPTAFTRAVLVPDGDEVKIFDAQLNLVRTLTGFKAPEGAGLDDLGRTWVADTGNNRLMRFGADGALDTSFADGGSLTLVEGKPLSSPTTLLLSNEYDAEDGGYHTEFELATKDGVVTYRDPARCYVTDERRAERLIRPTGTFAGHQDTWYLEGGRLLRDGDYREESSGTDAIDAARGTNGINPWWVVLKPEGRLEEHFSKVSNIRVTKLGYAASAVAVDGSADFVLHKRLGEGFSSRITGPHVIYIAGPGRLERRVLPQMTEGLW